MPRPQSELTSVSKTVSARLAPAHYSEWKRLGGIEWLRQYLSQSIKNREQQKPR